MITLSISAQSPELDDMLAQATLSQEHLESDTAELQSNAHQKKRSDLLTGHRCKALATLHLHG